MVLACLFVCLQYYYSSCCANEHAARKRAVRFPFWKMRSPCPMHARTLFFSVHEGLDKLLRARYSAILKIATYEYLLHTVRSK